MSEQTANDTLSNETIAKLAEGIAEKVANDVNITKEKKKSARRGFLAGTAFGTAVGGGIAVAAWAWKMRQG
jgi:hypothetical protein